MQSLVVSLLGLVLIAFGILGFLHNPLPAFFGLDPLHNIVHILTGLLALAAWMLGARPMRWWGRVSAFLYAGLALFGWIWPARMVFGLFHANMPAHSLHLALAAVFLASSFLHPRPTRIPEPVVVTA